MRYMLPLLVGLLLLCGCYSADEIFPGDIPAFVDYGLAPSFILEDLDSMNHDSNDLYDKVVLFLFVDVNCSDCPLDFVELDQLKDGIFDDDFMIVLIGDSASPQQISQYLDLHGYSSDLDLVDRTGNVIGDYVDLITEWEDPGYPFLILKDRDDGLRYAYEGSIKNEGMRPILDVLIRDLLSQ